MYVCQEAAVSISRISLEASKSYNKWKYRQFNISIVKGTVRSLY